jgi:hypothetical protein
MSTSFSQKLGFELAMLEQKRVSKKQSTITVYFNSSELHQTILKVSLHLTDICRKQWHLHMSDSSLSLGRIGSECGKNYVALQFVAHICVLRSYLI